MLKGLENHHHNTQRQQLPALLGPGKVQQPSLMEWDRSPLSMSVEFNNTFKCVLYIFLREKSVTAGLFKRRGKKEWKEKHKTVAKCILIAVIASIPLLEILYCISNMC